ncbi:MAG: response regulator transcription factor [Proteiniphilum sp.]|jgi:DNA-binding NarL/FixJ family response regulator|nr:response regulator transcription factor [Proteiniphilum sp.]
MPIRVVLIDDDKLITMSLKMILEHDSGIEVVSCGTDGSDALPMYEQHKPDIVLMDIRMKETDGLAAGRQLLASYPQARVLYLTTFADDEYLIQALRMGARGYILKQDYESLVPAVQSVVSGQSVYGDDIAARIPDLLSDHNMARDYLDWQQYELRDREQELVKLIAEGLNNKEIAAKLYLGEGTVRNTLSIILDKLQLRDRTQLAIWYYKQQYENDK